MVSVPPGPMLSEALVHSPVVVGEDGQPSVASSGMGGGGFGFDFDPNEDPELALVFLYINVYVCKLHCILKSICIKY